MTWCTGRRLATTAIGVALTLGGCGSVPSPTAGGASPTAAGPSPAAADGCPALKAVAGEGAAVDYADVVRFEGRQYLSHTATVQATAGPDEVGDVEFRVRCAFGELNTRTGQMPPPLRDGDSGWLPAGTEVHALRGWSRACRLVAQHDGTWLVYAALDPSASSSRPTACPPTPTG